MRRIISVLTAGLLFLGPVANAALINVAPNIWRDTATNLEWVDMRETTSQTLGLTDPSDPLSSATAAEIMTAALASDYVVNQGFQVATTAQVTVLYLGSGGADGIYSGPNQAPELFNIGTTDYFDDGIPFGSNYNSILQTGLHDDGSGSVVSSQYRLNIITSFDMQPNFIADGGSYVLAVLPDAEFHSYPYSVYEPTNHDAGVYLVRAAVPVPPAVWLFGSGLLALWRFRRTEH
ncbi:MAG: hypothetical protein ACR2QG_04215 [Gammaproteobacteria bacterium]